MRSIRRFGLAVMLAAMSLGQGYAQEPQSADDGNPYKELAELRKEQLAEKDKEIDDLKGRIAKLEKQLKQSGGKDSEIEKLKKQIEKLNAALEQAKKDLETERTASKDANYKKQVEELTKERDDLKASLEKAATVAAEECAAKVSELQAQRDADAARIAELSAELDGLANFRKVWLRELAGTVDEKWLGKPYSEIDSAELERAYSQYEEFADTDPKVAEARDKMKKLLDEYRIYHNGMLCISQMYDREKVTEAYNEVKGLKGRVSGAKASELEPLFKKLSDYRVTVDIFKELIDAVDGMKSGSERHAAAKPLVMAVLNNKKEDIDAIKAIPWLAGQYEKYQKALETDCLGEDAAGISKRIKDLKTE